MFIELSVEEVNLIVMAIEGNDPTTPEASAKYIKIKEKLQRSKAFQEAAEKGRNS